MDVQLRKALIATTQAFYRHHAHRFSDSRAGGWASWQRIIEQLPARPRSVIDYGCGNGRFLGFLHDSGLHVDYVGLDSDKTLLDIARLRHPDASFSVAQSPAGLNLHADLVTSFGVLHHIPGRAQRVEFVRELAELLAPHATLALSFWQPEALANFASKSTTDHSFVGLEPGDHLLGWNSSFEHLRYCHHFTHDEIDAIVQACELTELARFGGTDNDATNIYLLATR